MKLLLEGTLRKMEVSHESDDSVVYRFRAKKNKSGSHFEYADTKPHIGKKLKLEFSGDIYCINCGRKTKKSFSQGYCFVCFRSLAETDSCMMSPEKCHFHLGTCRDEEWAKQNCFQPHIVYLANTSKVKVGITRIHQVPIRWMDQGAVQAVPIVMVSNRYTSGIVEDFFKSMFDDKTSWQAMLKSSPEDIDMNMQKQKAHQYYQDHFSYDLAAPLGEISLIEENLSLSEFITKTLYKFKYPVSDYPQKVKSINAEKQPIIEGRLMGIKGQYLIFDQGVINMRKYTGYEAKIFSEN